MAKKTGGYMNWNIQRQKVNIHPLKPYAKQARQRKQKQQRAAQQRAYQRMSPVGKVAYKVTHSKAYHTVSKAANRVYKNVTHEIRRESHANNYGNRVQKLRQQIINNNKKTNKVSKNVVRTLNKSNAGRATLGAVNKFSSGVTYDAADLGAKAEGYKNYSAYRRSKVSNGAQELTKAQEQKLKSSKAYKRGAAVGDLASYAVGYGAAGKAIGKGAAKAVGSKLGKKAVSRAAERGAEELGKGAVKAAAKKGAKVAAEEGTAKAARKSSTIVGKAVGKAVSKAAKADIKAGIKEEAYQQGKKLTRKAVRKEAEKRVAKMTGKEARKYTSKAAKRIGTELAKDTIGDLTVGASMDTAHELAQGKTPDKKKFWKDMAANAAMNAATGGAVDVGGALIKGTAKKAGSHWVQRIGADGKKHYVRASVKEGERTVGKKTAKEAKDIAKASGRASVRHAAAENANDVLEGLKDRVKTRFKKANGISVEEAARRTGTTVDDVIKTAQKHDRKVGNMNLSEFESGRTTRGKRAAAKRSAKADAHRLNAEVNVTTEHGVNETVNRLSKGKNATVDGRGLLSLKRRQKAGEFGDMKIRVENHGGGKYTVRLTKGVSNVPADVDIRTAGVRRTDRKVTVEGIGERTAKGQPSRSALERRAEVRRALRGDGSPNVETPRAGAVREAENATTARGRLIASRDRLTQREAFRNARNATQADISKAGHATASEMLRDEGFVKYMKKNDIKYSSLVEDARENGTTVGDEMRTAYADYEAQKPQTVEHPTVSKTENVNTESAKARISEIKKQREQLSEQIQEVSAKALNESRSAEMHSDGSVHIKNGGGGDPKKLETYDQEYGRLVKQENALRQEQERLEGSLKTSEEGSGTQYEAQAEQPKGEVIGTVEGSNGEKIDVYRGGARGNGGSEGRFKGNESDTKQNINNWLKLDKEQQKAVDRAAPEHYGEKSQVSQRELDDNFNHAIEKDGDDSVLSSITRKVNENRQLDSTDLYYSGRLAEFYSNAYKETGDETYAQKLAQARTSFSIAASEAGKTLQSVQNFYKNTPEGRAMTVNAAIDRFGKANNILDLSEKIDSKLIDAVSNAKGKDELHDAEEKLRDAIWSNVPATWKDKLDAWRYFSMLSSPKTHIRNVLGNAFVMPMRGARNLVEMPIESRLAKKGVLDKRTKAVVNRFSEEGKEYYKTAKEVGNDIVPQIMNGSTKYELGSVGSARFEFLKKPEGRSNFNSKLGQKIFSPLERAERGVGWALEKEDEIAVRTNFEGAFASYMKANNIKPSDFKGMAESAKQDAIDYAANEALVATYRTKNSFATALSKLSKGVDKDSPLWRKGVAFLADSAVPFTKTPVNILKTSVDFSPAGFFNGIHNILKSGGDTKSLQKAVESMMGAGEGSMNKQAKEVIYKVCQNDELAKKLIDATEHVDGQEMRTVLKDERFQELLHEAKVSGTDQARLRKGIDQVASGIVGTPVLLAGIYLGANGMAQGAFDSQDAEDKYRRGMGEQEYSFRIGDKSYTFNWAVPAAMPLGIGVNVGNALQNDPDKDAKGIAFAQAWLDSAVKCLDPVTSMSMLSGIQNVLDTSYSNSSNVITAVAKNTATNYVSQFIPTVGGQIAQSLFTKDQLSSASTNANSTLRSFMNNVNYWKSRIPLLNRTLPKNYDVYGQLTKSPNVFESLLNPSNKKNVKSSAVDKELRSLVAKGYDKKILPQAANANELNNFQMDIGKKSFHMTEKEFAQYKKVRGKALLNGLDKLFKSDKWKDMNQSDREKAISDVYTDAKEAAKKDFYLNRGVSETDYNYEKVLKQSQRAKFKSAKKAGVSKETFVKYTLDKNKGSGQVSQAFAAIKAGATDYRQVKHLAGNSNMKISHTSYNGAKYLSEHGFTQKDFEKYSKERKKVGGDQTLDKALALYNSGVRDYKTANMVLRSENSVFKEDTWNTVKKLHSNKDFRKYYKTSKKMPHPGNFIEKAYAAVKAGADNNQEANKLTGSTIWGSSWNKAVYAYNKGISVKFLDRVANLPAQERSKLQVTKTSRNGNKYTYKDAYKTYKYVETHFKTKKERQWAWYLLKEDNKHFNAYGF